jgi:hypothetical protein
MNLGMAAPCCSYSSRGVSVLCRVNYDTFCLIDIHSAIHVRVVCYAALDRPGRDEGRDLGAGAAIIVGAAFRGRATVSGALTGRSVCVSRRTPPGRSHRGQGVD